MKIKKALAMVCLSSFITLTAATLRADSGYFASRQFTYDVFGTYGTRDREDFDDGQFGIGVGINYFFTSYFGLGADTYVEDIDFPNHMDISAIGRWPLQTVPIAPYIFGGFGRQWTDRAQWTGHIGIGVEYDWSERAGIFFDARAVIPGKSSNLGLFRLGLKLGF